MSTNLPEQFGKYVLLRKIAMGGMAEIFRAKATGAAGFEKEIVIKRILPHFTEDESFVKMFIDEASIAAKLQHANIVQIFDFAQHNGRYFIAMEYIEGKDLKKLMEEGVKSEKPLSPAQTVWIMMEISKGLHYAHEKTHKGKPLNIVHRDISPHNAMVSFNGEVKLMDFGIAKAASRSTKTIAGTVKGKCAYMSPEQARGKPLDGRSDLFGLGVVMWEMLTHKRLFLGDSDFETLTNVLKADAPAPSSLNPDVPPELDAIVLRALGKDRDDRHEDVRGFNRELTKWFYSNVDDLDEVALGPWMRDMFEVDISKLQAQQAEERTMALSAAPTESDLLPGGVATPAAVVPAAATPAAPQAPNPPTSPSAVAVDNADKTVALPLGSGKATSAPVSPHDAPTLAPGEVHIAELNAALAAREAQVGADDATQALPLGSVGGHLAAGQSQPAIMVPNTNTALQPGADYATGGGRTGLLVAVMLLLVVLGVGGWWFLMGPGAERSSSPGASHDLPSAVVDIEIQIEPSDAQLRVNDKPSGTTLRGVAVSDWISIEASKPGYETLKEVFQASLDRTTVSLTLQKEQRAVAVMIKPSPSSAIVLVDGEELGPGAQQVKRNEGEQIKVELRPASGVGPTVTQSVTIMESTPVVEVALPVENRVPAQVAIGCNVKGVQLTTSAGQVEPRGDGYILTGIFVGDSVRIEARHSSHDLWQKDHIVRGPSELVDIRLRPKATAETGTGTIRINAKPWAKVNVNGKDKGLVPVVLRGVKTGSYRITLSGPGGRTATKNLRLRPNQKRTVTHDFTSGD